MELRGVFRTQSNIYEGAESRQLFLLKTSIVDVQIGSRYAFGTRLANRHAL